MTSPLSGSKEPLSIEDGKVQLVARAVTVISRQRATGAVLGGTQFTSSQCASLSEPKAAKEK
jgi:hypothetical protein